MDKHAENGPTRKKIVRKDKKDASLHNIRKKRKTKQNPVQLAQHMDFYITRTENLFDASYLRGKNVRY